MTDLTLSDYYGQDLESGLVTLPPLNLGESQEGGARKGERAPRKRS